ncbi:twin-arginine translocation signal domain-containing protein [Glaciihabitans arcticus]|uniref:Twin-arginine translocation signal domain-containing protein n=1 Tax=Glaciihabitans arcticus TaxID=2668039 RepID=A0A4Q9GYR8_9MICO|nr:molybdopterin-dependent oxidoreductase [Glaciihabitans arcticus]TBN57480.1 twin-arginine translocation signal domain-containing protein [Glaciihabitans arcticus]
MNPRAITLWAALVGVVSAVVALAVAEAVALLVAPSSAPLFAVGSFVIDIVPPWVKDAAIALFGTADKVALLVVLGVVVIALACAAGIVEYRRPPWGKVILLAVIAVALLAVLTRAESTAIWSAPTLAGLLAGGLTLHRVTRRLHRWEESSPELPLGGPDETTRGRIDRRGFLTMVVAVAGASAVVGIGARMVNASVTAVTAIREAVTLPKPAVVAPGVPAGAELGLPGLSPVISDNEGFYRIDTAIQVPSVETADWKLRITGMVENEIEVTWDELLALPMIETYVTLMCVSNEVGGTLVGNAKWLGYPIHNLLARAKPLAGADMVLSTSIDGWTAGTPLEVLQDQDRDSILAVGMNGEPLPLEHGFPVRMVVPGLYGYVSATKWVTELRVTRFDDENAYWTNRGWSALGPVKTSSRIDVPRDGRRITAGTVPIAGVAWAQHTGIDGVEVRVDGGPWLAAKLATAISADTWVQWVYEWDATPGQHEIQARATDSSGGAQSGDDSIGVVPNGAEGWHTVSVSVS